MFEFAKNVSFNIASEASYLYILSENAKNCQFGEFFWKPEALGQTVLPDRSILKGQKLVENVKVKWDIFGDFQTIWDTYQVCKLIMSSFFFLKQE